MDPVSAVGIASASAQFITFASQVISTTAEIYDSENDTSESISNLDAVCSQLQKLCQNLNQASERVNKDQVTSNPHATATKISMYDNTPNFNPLGKSNDLGILESASEVELAMGNIFPELQSVYASLQAVLWTCEKDSIYILSIISKLKPDKRAGSLIMSFKMAFKTVWKKDEIQKVEKRLQRSQGVLMALMCRISNIYHTQHARELAALRQESQLLGAKHTEQLSNMQDTLRVIEKERKTTHGSETLGNEINSLEQMMRQFSLSESRVRKELDIIRSLSFKTRQLRHDCIPVAHQETFRWVFKSSTSQETATDKKQKTSESKLLKWLEHGSGVFWVSGKPGSGKSTFMKFIADHRKTAEALSRWSHPLRPIISSCYFWSSGTDMQKSLTGLLQTLLYDVFRCCPQLIQNACPSRWSGRISEQPEVPFRFCFFIDGLDEYDGDHIDFCEYLTTILSQNIKLCLSSRPWNVFNDAFGQDAASRLFIHELTWSDILSYAQDRLHRPPRWPCLASQTKKAGSLARTIATRAQGVFLWVFLVTRLLREGLTNDDSFTDLERRLSSFPTELEAFFKQMLESVPSFYHEKMAGALQIALYAREPLDSMVYSFLDDEHEDEDYFLHLPVFEQDVDWVQMRQEQTVRLLNGRCRGLLEEQLGKINFLHRTVADFLRTREMSDFLDSRSGKAFKPGLSILKAYTAWLKTSSLEHGNFMLYESDQVSEHGFDQTFLYRGVRTALKYASYLELDPDVTKTTLDSLIDEIDSTLSDLAVVINPVRLLNFPDAYEHVSRLCRILSPDLPLMGFLSRKLSTEPRFLCILNQSPISLVLWAPTISGATWPVACRQKLDLVLGAGSNPNEPTMGAMRLTTIWQKFLSEILPKGALNGLTEASPKFQPALEMGLIQAFLDHGANPRATVWLDSVNVTSVFTIFVAAAFDIHWNERAEEMYFQSLGSFIHKGATLDHSDSHHMSQSAYWQETLAGSATKRGGEHHEILFDRLEKSLDLIDKFDNKSQRLFIAKLTRKIIPCAREASWPLEKYQHLIDRALHAQGPRCFNAPTVWLKRDSTLLELDDQERETKRICHGNY
ncbi:hypothetical protein CEP53_008087 [Fusarium sp. AF-6]|nr:hypothetical protein CEP53_008087 [Fusarium sp. AF-6]